MGTFVCRALQHTGRGDEPRMAPQAGSAISEMSDLVGWSTRGPMTVVQIGPEKTWIVAKIESLHGMTPAEIFQSGLENLNEIEAIAAAVVWKNGSVTAGWSNTDPSKIALMVLALDEEQRKMHFRD